MSLPNPTYGAVSVSTNPTVILASNPQRRGCLIVNNETSATIYLGFDTSLTTANGLPLAAGASLNNSDDSALWRGVIYGIVGSATADVRYWEWIA